MKSQLRKPGLSIASYRIAVSIACCYLSLGCLADFANAQPRGTSGLANSATPPGPGVPPAATAIVTPAVSDTRTATAGGLIPNPSTTAHNLDRADLEVWLDGLIPYGIETGDIAGGVITVVKDGELVFAKGYDYPTWRATRFPHSGPAELR
jgi:hypothetical protein